MRKIFVKTGTGFIGEEGYEVIEVEDNYSEEEINDIAYQMACDQASMYGHEVGTYDDEDDEYSEYSDDQLEYYWEDYDSEKHDCYL